VKNLEKERQKKIEEMNQETKRLVSHSPYFKKIEKQYEEKVLMPSLEQKKKIL
jgi:hypothetical protein